MFGHYKLDDTLPLYSQVSTYEINQEHLDVYGGLVVVYQLVFISHDVIIGFGLKSCIYIVSRWGSISSSMFYQWATIFKSYDLYNLHTRGHLYTSQAGGLSFNYFTKTLGSLALDEFDSIPNYLIKISLQSIPNDFVAYAPLLLKMVSLVQLNIN